MSNTDTAKGTPVTKNPFQLGKQFQEKVLQALVYDRSWAASFIEVFSVDECFEYDSLKFITNKYIGHYKAYKEFPSLEILPTLLSDSLRNGNDVALKEQVIAALNKLVRHEDLGDLGWVKERAYDFCRRQTMLRALGESIELLESNNYETVVDVVKKAMAAGTPTEQGLEYVDEIDVRYSQTYRHTVPTGVPELDDKLILNGGLGKGEIGIVVAATGVGKSHVLVDFGAAALKAKKNVLHITFELNERITGIRYDSNLIGIDSTDCPEHKEYIKEFFEKNKPELGRLQIKHMRGATTTVNTIRAYIEKIQTAINFKTDLLIVDYAGIMRSTVKYEAPRFELKKVIEELRDLGEELDFPVWTALQSNKEGVKSDYVDTSNLSEGFGQGHAVDFLIGLTRKPEDKQSGIGSLFIGKNRAGQDGIKIDIRLDTAQSRIQILSKEAAAEYRSTYEKAKAVIDSENKNKAAQALKTLVRENKDLFLNTKDVAKAQQMGVDVREIIGE